LNPIVKPNLSIDLKKDMKVFFARVMFLLMVLPGAVSGQSNKLVVPHKLDTNFVHYFLGNWRGEGEFSNGRKIAAKINFSLSLDGAWLVRNHVDEPPNGYKAVSYWGVDRVTGQFVATEFDNFQGHRTFTSDGWVGNRIVLTTNASQAGGLLLYQHFIFERISETSFKMTFETSKDGQLWKMGDYLIFTKELAGSPPR
jgi:hypothetical protein